MMVDLYLDDERPEPKGWVRSATVEDAKTWLVGGTVDRLSLDHDLGCCMACAGAWRVGATPNACSHADTGMDLVTWMIETGYWPRQKPEVHSANPVGAYRMRKAIDLHWKQSI